MCQHRIPYEQQLFKQNKRYQNPSLPGFHLFSNSPYCMSYNSYDVSLENQVLDQPIPLSIFSFNLITCLLDILLLL